MIQTTLFLADKHLKKLTCHRCGRRLFVPHPLAKVAKEKNTGKRYLQYLNEKIIIITYMTFVRMNYVFEFTFILRTSISLVNT